MTELQLLLPVHELGWKLTVVWQHTSAGLCPSPLRLLVEHQVGLSLLSIFTHVRASQLGNKEWQTGLLCIMTYASCSWERSYFTWFNNSIVFPNSVAKVGLSSFSLGIGSLRGVLRQCLKTGRKYNAVGRCGRIREPMFHILALLLISCVTLC